MSNELDDLDNTAPVDQAVDLDADDGSDAAFDAAFDAASKEVDATEKAEPAPRARDEAGKFAKAKADAAAKSGVEPNAGDTETVAPDAGTEPAAAEAPTNDLFADWHDDWKGKLAAVPAEHHKLIAESHGVIKDHYEKQVQAISQEAQGLKGYAERVQPLVDAYRENADYLNRRSSELGINPVQLQNNLMRVDGMIAHGPIATREAMARRYLEESGLKHLLKDPNDPFAEPMTPEQQALQDRAEEVARLKYENSQHTNYRNQQQTQALTSTWSAFADAKQSDGSPQYPFAKQVQRDIGYLLESGRANTLDQAYAMAAKPLHDEIERRSRSSQETARKLMADSVAKAKKAAPIKVSGMSRGGGRLESLDDILG
jgi:hypothetical protein